MSVPEQVRRQAEAAQAHFENSEQDGNTANPPPETEIEPPAQQPPTAPEPSPQQPEQAGADQTTYEQRYRSLQGMYNAEVPRLQQTNRELNGRLQNLEALIASMQTPEPASQATSQVRQLLSDNERSEYGDSIDVMRKVSREELDPLYGRLTQMEQHLSNLNGTLTSTVLPQVNQVAQQQHVSQQDQFWASLSRAVPNWQQINNDPDFHTWLLEVDPMAGVSRQQMLESQHQRFNITGVAAFFDTFVRATGKYNTAAQPNRSANELERQVSPGRSRSAPAHQSTSPKTYTQRDISVFFDEVRQGKYKGREDERNRIERDIFAAQQDGRIVASA